MLESLMLEAAFCFLNKKMRAIELVGALELQVLRHDAAVPAQPQPTELNLPSFLAQLLHHAPFHEFGQANSVEEESRHHHAQDQAQPGHPRAPEDSPEDLPGAPARGLSQI